VCVCVTCFSLNRHPSSTLRPVRSQIPEGEPNGSTLTLDTRALPWPLQDIVSLRVVCARINRPFISTAYLHCPHSCNTIARLLQNIRPPLPPSTSLVYAIQHTILAIRISCKGQALHSARRQTPEEETVREGLCSHRRSWAETLPGIYIYIYIHIYI